MLLYDRVILPLGSKIIGKPISLTTKQRMGMEIFVSFLAMAVSAVVEGIQRDRAVKVGNLNEPRATVQMSAMWLAGNLIASFSLSTIDDVTGREGKASWISSNINEGHYDYYY